MQVATIEPGRGRVGGAVQSVVPLTLPLAGFCPPGSPVGHAEVTVGSRASEYCAWSFIRSVFSAGFLTLRSGSVLLRGPVTLWWWE